MMEIRFKRDTAFRKTFFVPDSFSHPAKMDAQLLLWIVNKYSEAGETILDPMAGSGTSMLACTLGRDVILVELEEKFCKMMRDNWEQVKMRPQLGSTMGTCQIIQGDARQLEGLVDKIVTSPPYAESVVVVDGEFYKKMRIDTRRNPEAPASRGAREGIDNPDNISNLPYGEIDKCIFSPPYEGSIIDGNENFEGLRKIRGDKASQKDKFRAIQFGKETTAYGQIDKIVTSPPYEGSLSGIDDEDRAKEFERMKTRGMRFNPLSHSNVTRGTEYSDSSSNIGNLKSQSYLEAMLQVYQQCFSVLRDGGLMVLVTKNFIRNKQVIRLDEDTIKLCEQAGFSFVERHYRELPSQSFWRVIYHQKFPDVEQIKNEDVLVFKKL